MLIEEFLQMKLAYLALGKLKEVKLGSIDFSSKIVSYLSILALAATQLKDCIVWVYLLAVALRGLQEGIFLVELGLRWLILEKPAEASRSLLGCYRDKVKMLLLVILIDFLYGLSLLRQTEDSGLDHFCYCCLHDSYIFTAVLSVCTDLVAVSTFFLMRKELGINAKML